MERLAVLQKACDYLARREHSRAELERKLSQRCDDLDLVHELLDKLSAEGLQSDDRYVENFIHHRLKKGQGPLKIRQDLKHSGVDDGLIQSALAEVSEDWYELACQVRVKRFGEFAPKDIKDKAKQSRFLYSRVLIRT